MSNIQLGRSAVKALATGALYGLIRNNVGGRMGGFAMGQNEMKQIGVAAGASFVADLTKDTIITWIPEIGDGSLNLILHQSVGPVVTGVAVVVGEKFLVQLPFQGNSGEYVWSFAVGATSNMLADYAVGIFIPDK